MMKNYKKHIIITFVAIFVFILFQTVAVYGATDSDAYKDGYSNGLWEGGDAAYDDLEDVKPKNFRKALPKDDEIISRFDLDKESTAYKRDFIRGYKAGFEVGYNNTYDNPRIEITPTNYDEIVGYELGKASGLSDFYNGKKNKWAEAVPSTTKLIELFGLKNEASAYKNEFILNFKKEFQKGYETAYKNAKFEPMANALLRGEEDGEKIGGLLGKNYGRKDFYDKVNIDWKRNLPSDDDIKKTFSLHNEVPDYVKSFIASFKTAFQKEYNDAYRDANVEYNSTLFDQGYDNGKNLGNIKGASNANIDYLMGKPNNVERYTFSEQNLIKEYKLHNENKRYRDGFIAGFKEGFSIGYIEMYQSASVGSFEEKIIEEIVPLSGGEVVSGDGKLKVVLDSGTFYNDVIVSLDKYMQTTDTVDLPNIDVYTKSSDMYLLKVNNPYNKYDNDKQINLSFEFYGGINGGIYRYHYGAWRYLPSKVTENSISAYISPKLAQENSIYGVFIYDNAVNPLDIRGHWAKDEIVTALRRGYSGLYNDSTFRPDAELTKVQMLMYLSLANKWKADVTDEELSFVENLRDYNEIKDIKELAAFGIKNGFLSISKDNRFNPKDGISYKELENILKKVKNDKNFTWKWVSDKMATIKDKRCSSLDSMNNKVTRAEFVYALNFLSE